MAVVSAFAELASVAYLEGRVENPVSPLQRRACEIMLDEERRRADRERREIRRMIRRGELSEAQVRRALSR